MDARKSEVSVDHLMKRKRADTATRRAFVSDDIATAGYGGTCSDGMLADTGVVITSATPLEADLFGPLWDRLGWICETRYPAVLAEATEGGFLVAKLNDEPIGCIVASLNSSTVVVAGAAGSPRSPSPAFLGKSRIL